MLVCPPCGRKLPVGVSIRQDAAPTWEVAESRVPPTLAANRILPPLAFLPVPVPRRGGQNPQQGRKYDHRGHQTGGRTATGFFLWPTLRTRYRRLCDCSRESEERKKATEVTFLRFSLGYLDYTDPGAFVKSLLASRRLVSHLSQESQSQSAKLARAPVGFH